MSKVPDLSRYEFEIVRDVLKKHGLSLGDVTGKPNSAQKGTILWQSFEPGSAAKCGTAISIAVSTGPRLRDDVKVPPDPQGAGRCEVPDLTKHHIDDVQAPLRKRQWSIGKVVPQESRAKPGTILKQSPQPGVYEKCDWSIDVLVAVPVAEPPHPQDPPGCKVIDFTGLNIKDALGRVKGAGLGVESVVRQLSPAPADVVIAQSAKPGTVLPCGSRLVLAIATPPPPPQIQYCDVPDMRGADLSVAQRTVAAAGLKVGGVKPENSDRPRDTVITQSLKAGSQVPCGSPVYLRASAGPAMCDVPNLEAVDLAGARRLLKERNFQLGKVSTQNSERIADTVLGQQPPANSTAVCNSAIDVLIAVPMPPVHVPALQGQDTVSARRKLEDASLTLGPVARKFSDEAAGLVIEQQPVADTPVRRGSSVRVWVSDGPAPRPVPDLRRLDRGTAADVLSEARFRLGQVFDRQFDATPGTIVDQQPAAGSVERVGTVVQVWVAVPVLVAVPSVIGKRESDAAATLATVQLRAGKITTRQSTQPRGTVLEQRPAPDQLVVANDTVDLVVAVPMPPPPPAITRPETPPPPVVAPPEPSGVSVSPAVPAVPVAPNPVTPIPVTPIAVPAVPVPAVPEATVTLLPAETPPATVANAPPPPVPVLAAIPNVVGSSATQASNALRTAGFVAGALSTTPSAAPAGTVTSQRPAAGQPAAPGTQVALEIAMPVPSQGTMPMWWVLLGIVAGAAAAGLMAKMRTRVPRALPPSVTFEPRPDANMAVTLSGDGPLVGSELWLKACPDAGVQTAHGAGPFGMMEVTESR